MTSTTGPIIYSRPLPSNGGSVHECIHTERRSSTGDKDEGIQTMLLAMVEGWRHRDLCDM